MFGKLALMGAASLLAYAGFAGIPFTASETVTPQGRIYHYARSDGGPPSHVYVYRAADNRIEIYQANRRCADAGFSTAWVSPDSGRASVITRGRLLPRARHEILASFNYDGTQKILRAEAARGDAMARGRIDMESANWHLADLDLATLSVQTMALDSPHAGFSFQLPGTRVGGNLLENRGGIRAEFAAAEDYRGAETLRFALSGTALDGGAGNLWLDADSRHIVAAEWDGADGPYRLRLIDTDDGGEAGWNALLARHYDGCAAA